MGEHLEKLEVHYAVFVYPKGALLLELYHVLVDIGEPVAEVRAFDAFKGICLVEFVEQSQRQSSPKVSEVCLVNYVISQLAVYLDNFGGICDNRGAIVVEGLLSVS